MLRLLEEVELANHLFTVGLRQMAMVSVMPLNCRGLKHGTTIQHKT